MLAWALTIPAAFGRGITAAGKWLLRDGRWKLALLALTALVVAFSVRGCVRAQADRDVAQQAAQATEEARVAGDRAVTGSTAAKAAITKRHSAGNARMEIVLERNEDWASQPVPNDVLDGLRDN